MLYGLNSGGIDSPVAMHQFLRHNLKVAAVIFDNQPFSTPGSVDTALNTVELLEEEHGTEIETWVVPHGFIQEHFLNEAGEDNVKYNCLFSRRLMLKTAAALAEKNNGTGLVTGESLGQVASQTLENLVVTDAATTTPIYRPLIGLDKTDITQIAKNIGTYETSSQGGISCAAHIEYPETRGVVEELEHIEQQFDIDQLVEESLEKAEQQG